MKNSDLPEKVRIKHGSYYYVKRVEKRLTWTKLTRVKEGLPSLYEALATLHRESSGVQDETVSYLIAEYLIGGTDHLAPKTLKNYHLHSKELKRVFGPLRAKSIPSTEIAKYLEICRKNGTGGMANHQVGVLSSAYSWGMRYGLAAENPCLGVRRNPKKPRDRYIEHGEFNKVFYASKGYVQDLFALAYLTGFRQADLLKLKRTDLKKDGIHIVENKTRKRRVVLWSDTLSEFVVRAQTRAPESKYVLCNSKGRPLGAWAVQSIMRRVKARHGSDWNFHDIRAKAESDSENGLGLMPLYKRSTVTKAVR